MQHHLSHFARPEQQNNKYHTGQNERNIIRKNNIKNSPDCCHSTTVKYTLSIYIKLEVAKYPAGNVFVLAYAEKSKWEHLKLFKCLTTFILSGAFEMYFYKWSWCSWMNSSGSLHRKAKRIWSCCLKKVKWQLKHTDWKVCFCSWKKLKWQLKQ